MLARLISVPVEAVLRDTTDNLINFQTLQKEYPTIQYVNRALIELEYLEHMPAGVRVYFSDIHGQGDKFEHLISNLIGIFEKLIDDIFPSISIAQRHKMYALCCYPQEALEYRDQDDKRLISEEDYPLLIKQLTQLVRSIVVQRMTADRFEKLTHETANAELITELVNLNRNGGKSEGSETGLINKIIKYKLAPSVLMDMVTILKAALVSKYIINGDIPDRGPDTAKVLDILMSMDNRPQRIIYNWGNHEMLPMGAAAGNKFSVLDWPRIQLRYGEQAIIEQDYGIDLTPVYTFAHKTYKKPVGKGFHAKVDKTYAKGHWTYEALAKAQKALLVIQLKIEKDLGDILSDEKGLYVRANNFNVYLDDQDFPTIDWKHPHRLTLGEKHILRYLQKAFRRSERLYTHACFLAKGAMYHIVDQTLSFHGMIPLNEDGSLKFVEINGKKLAGRELLDYITAEVRKAFNTSHPTQRSIDLLYWLWKSPDSPLFGKHKMQTRNAALFVKKQDASPELQDAVAALHKEKKAPFYTLMEDEGKNAAIVQMIIDDFSQNTVNTIKHIVVGHVVKKAEEAVKAHGKFIFGDGGFSQAYQKEGSQGFCVMETSRGRYLLRLDQPVSLDDFMSNGRGIIPQEVYAETFTADLPQRKLFRYLGTDVAMWPQAIVNLFEDCRREMLVWKKPLIKKSDMHGLVFGLSALSSQDKRSVFKLLWGTMTRERQLRDTDTYATIVAKKQALIKLKEKYLQEGFDAL